VALCVAAIKNIASHGNARTDAAMDRLAGAFVRVVYEVAYAITSRRKRDDDAGRR